jgi:hypothetical protein
MKRIFGKSIKMLILTLMSVLVISVTAATYYSLTLTSSIDVYQADVYFVEGSDNGTSAVVLTLDSTNTTTTITGLRAYPNMTFTYENVTLVRNNSTIAASNIRLTPGAITPANPADFVYVKFMLNATNLGDRRWLNYTSNGVSWTVPPASSWTSIGVSTQWPVVIMTMANSTATVGNTVTIGITIDVD